MRKMCRMVLRRTSPWHSIPIFLIPPGLAPGATTTTTIEVGVLTYGICYCDDGKHHPQDGTYEGYMERTGRRPAKR